MIAARPLLRRAAAFGRLAVPCLAASVPATAGAWSAALGPVAGSVALDPHLRDYRWDTAPRAGYGLVARLQSGRLGGGVRAWRATTTQALGAASDATDPEVALTSLDLIGETRVADLAGFHALALASIGRLHLGYSPDAVQVDDGSGGTIDVRFDPIAEWSTGLGLAIRRPVGSGWTAGGSLERTWFRLDTFHRAGADIVSARETFGHWTARVEFTRRLLPTRGTK